MALLARFEGAAEKHTLHLARVPQRLNSLLKNSTQVLWGLKSVRENSCRPCVVCVVASLSPRWRLFSFHFLRTACAVGCILTPLRGSTELAGPLLGRRSSYDTDSSGAESAWCFAAQKTLAQDDQVLV